LNLLDWDFGLNLNLSLRRTGQDKRGDNRCGTNAWAHDGLTGYFLGSSCALAGRNDDGLGSGHGRRAAICEGADARQACIRRACHRRTSQNEGEGKDEAEGSHLIVSGLGLPALSRRFVARLIAKRCFRMSARKAGNGFVGGENCFVAAGSTKQFAENLNDFRRAIQTEADLGQTPRNRPAAAGNRKRAARVCRSLNQQRSSTDRRHQVGRLFNLSLVEKQLGPLTIVNRSVAAADLSSSHATFLSNCAL
jgi:hypothetical protein